MDLKSALEIIGITIVVLVGVAGVLYLVGSRLFNNRTFFSLR